jgi:hypothetical protein
MSLSMIPKTLIGMNRRKSIPGQRDLFDGLFVCCSICGRKLTSERSRRRGVGPACAKRDELSAVSGQQNKRLTAPRRS